MVMQGTDMKVAETPTGQLEDFRVPTPTRTGWRAKG